MNLELDLFGGNEDSLQSVSRYPEESALISFNFVGTLLDCLVCLGNL